MLLFINIKYKIGINILKKLLLPVTSFYSCASYIFFVTANTHIITIVAIVIFQFQFIGSNIDTTVIIWCCLLNSFHLGFVTFSLMFEFTTFRLIGIDVLHFISW